MSNNEVILVDLVNFQNYIVDNIKNLKLFGNTNITVLTNSNLRHHFETLGVNIVSVESLEDTTTTYFNSKNKYQNTNRYKIRNGFWSHASKRFFYLYNYLKIYIHYYNHPFLRLNCQHQVSNLQQPIDSKLQFFQHNLLIEQYYQAN